MKLLLSLICLLAFPALLQASPFHLSPYKLVDVTVYSQTPELLSIESQWQYGDNELNHFRIKRILNRNNIFKPFKPFKPILFVAPFNATLEHYTLSSTGDYRDSIEAQLSLAGYDVWIVEDRMYTGAPEDCEQRYDCSVIGTWGLASRSQDIELTRQLIKHATGVSNPVIGGITGGGIAAMAAVNAHPENFRALFSTGGFYSQDETIRDYNRTTCELFRAAVEAGDYYRESLGGLEMLIVLARNDPDGISPFDPSVTNYQLVVNLLTGAGMLGFLSYTPEYRFAAPTATLDDYKYMNAELFYEDSHYFGTLVSHSHFSDIYCTIAGDDSFINQLKYFKGNALFLGGGHGMTPLQIDNLPLFARANVVVISDPEDGGEADNYLVDLEWRQQVLDGPLLKWLSRQYPDSGKPDFPWFN